MLIYRMVKRHIKQPDGKYHVNGKKYDILVGSRAQVYHGTAYKTSGGLTKGDLIQNKHGRIVSASKHKTAKKEKRLQKHGYTARKGKFGAVKMSVKSASPGSKTKRRTAKRRKTVGGRK